MLVLEQICSELTTEVIRKMAYDCKFVQRIRLIQPEIFLSVLCESSINGFLSCNDLASTTSIEYNIDAARQSYFYKMTAPAVEFLKRILAFVLQVRCNISANETRGRYKRILIQDSTVIKLPGKLYKDFSGVSNGRKAACNARIQCVYDILAGEYIHFSIDPYYKNDLKVAHEIDVKDGDLLLRDRGYFIPAVLEEKRRDGAEQIFRYKHKTKLFNTKTQKSVDLLTFLQVNQTLDQFFYIGKNKDIKVRVMATPVSEELANIRRMNAKREAKNHVCSENLLKLLGWSIFVTTIEDEELTVHDIYKLYSLRWRIENIFKTWKSEMNFTKLHTVSKIQLEIVMYARLIMIVLFYHHFYIPLSKVIKKEHKKEVSLFKLIRYLTRNLKLVATLYSVTETTTEIIRKIAKYCTYDQRKRESFTDLFSSVLDKYIFLT